MLKTLLSIRQNATGFQVEVATIEHCTGELDKQKTVNKIFAIFSHSQAAIKALRSYLVSSRLVDSILSTLNELDIQNKVTLAWVPQHEGHKNNEEADALAPCGSIHGHGRSRTLLWDSNGMNVNQVSSQLHSTYLSIHC